MYLFTAGGKDLGGWVITSKVFRQPISQEMQQV